VREKRESERKREREGAREGWRERVCERHCVYHTATQCIALQYTATNCNTLQHDSRANAREFIHEPMTRAYKGALQHTATHCSALHHATAHCNTLIHYYYTTHVPTPVSSSTIQSPERTKARWSSTESTLKIRNTLSEAWIYTCIYVHIYIYIHIYIYVFVWESTLNIRNTLFEVCIYTCIMYMCICIYMNVCRTDAAPNRLLTSVSQYLRPVYTNT